MRKSLKITLLLSMIVLFNCGSKQECQENINLLPMYGEVKKCEEQIRLDNDFLKTCDQKYKTRKEASKYFTEKAWGYFYKNDLETSMKRFNQAWLLDKENYETYWGFGNILGKKQMYKESIKYLEKSNKINTKNSNLYFCLALSYGQLYFKKQDGKLLDKSVSNLKKSIALDKMNTSAYAQLTAAYSLTYFTQRDSARKYLKITDKLDQNAINPKVRRILE